ncbi:hypothetical protein MASR2M18_07890 [Ignavibacteria bacterium]|nr:T9SS type A sorting domain-containing protein [Bacteroidota bacterium]MCZ2132918.1 T9SS type A sorting domain-containing protein [Bacteroidota bacterium]
MRFYISIFIVVLLAQVSLFAQWEQIKGPDGEYYILSIVSQNNYLYAGTGSGVFRSTDNGVTWQKKSSGLNALSVTCLLQLGNYQYAGTYGGGVYRSSDNGDSWQQNISGLNSLYVYCLIKFGDYLYVGMDNGVYSSSDNGDNWRSSGLSTLTIYTLLQFGDYLYAGTGKGVYSSSDDGYSWQQKNSGLNTLSFYTLLQFSDYLYAGGQWGGVHRSTDKGENWQSSGINETSIYSITQFGEYLYVSTFNHGVYLSTDKGDSWINIGLMEQDVRTLVISGGYLFAGTYGNGIWKIPLSATNIEEREENENLGSSIRTYPNPSEGTLTIEIEDANASNDIYDVMMYDMYGRQMGIYQIHNKQTIDVNTLPIGQYQLKVQNAQTQSIFVPSIFSIMR